MNCLNSSVSSFNTAVVGDARKDCLGDEFPDPVEDAAWAIVFARGVQLRDQQVQEELSSQAAFVYGRTQDREL